MLVLSCPLEGVVVGILAGVCKFEEGLEGLGIIILERDHATAGFLLIAKLAAHLTDNAYKSLTNEG